MSFSTYLCVGLQPWLCVLEGSLEIDVRMWSEIGNLIYERHLFSLTALMILTFILNTCASHIPIRMMKTNPTFLFVIRIRIWIGYKRKKICQKIELLFAKSKKTWTKYCQA